MITVFPVFVMVEPAMTAYGVADPRLMGVIAKSRHSRHGDNRDDAKQANTKRLHATSGAEEITPPGKGCEKLGEGSEEGEGTVCCRGRTHTNTSS